jgi:hypothetical protein
MVVIGVEDELHLVAVTGGLVPSHQLTPHAAGTLIIEHAGADVEPLVVVQNPDFGSLGCRLAYARLGLPEVGGRLRLGPDRFVEPAIQHDRGGPGHRANRWRGEGVRGGGMG